MKNYFFILLGGVLLLLTSCTSGLKDSEKETLYVVNTDSTIVVYKHGSKEPVTLKKPIMVDELKKFSIPYSVLTTSDKNPGMRRYVKGEEDDAYEINFATAILSFLGVVFIIALVALIFHRD